ncbi:DNA polymerase-3 subunit gamma/tau [bacterium A37T11]|nr:DNA polymerase-3 subunit gamma/tau [bacterium A37T11]
MRNFVPMDNFIVSARKYRPATFDTVVGQQHITGTLKNAIKNNQLAQAFLFCGPRGVGKTTCARILAKTINCQQLTAETEACGKCESCVSFQQGASFSIHELDAASNNSVEDIRSLIEQVRIPPQTGIYKIYIIDEVHMLSQAAFNAFLKTLEEPPSYAIFILATTEKHKILPTILSRCQIFDFNRIRVEDMASHLASIADREGIVFDKDGLHLIAQKADGGLRDALSMFDQIVSFSNKKVTYQAVIDNLNILDYDFYFKVTDAILAEDASTILLTFDEILNHGFDGNHFISGLSAHFRNLLVGKDLTTLKLLEVSDNIRQRYLTQAGECSVGLLLSALNLANQCEVTYRNSKNQRLQVELALLKMCHISSAIQLAKIGNGERQESVKKKRDDVLKGPSGQPQQHESVAKPIPVVTSAPTALTLPSAERAPVEQNPTHAAKSNWKNVQISTSLPNLSNIFDDKAEEGKQEPHYIKGDAREPFTYEELLPHWHRFADQAKSETKLSLFTIMTANAPRLVDNFQLEVVVENAVQENVLTGSKIDLLNYIRQALRNFAIDIIPVQQKQDIKRKPYTNQEKYQALVAKNPILDKLRQEFNLRFD